MGDSERTADGIRLNTRYVERDGRPWFPVMGEYHFSRDQPGRWEAELRKMTAGGINVVATYLLWIVHEEFRGQVRWDGHRDLRRFVETAGRVGLRVVLRIGPWTHGETRNGGFPDWLRSLPVGHRTNDPAYLELVHGWYSAISEQVGGLFHGADNPSGPIVGVQVDNELHDQPDHLARLRGLAEETGMEAPLWVATGWGGARLPENVLLPVYAGYSDAFWEASTTGWPDFGVLHFTFTTVRDDLSVGADLREDPTGEPVPAATGQQDPWPFATCELGGGMQVAYHRRPLVDPDDVAALALTKLGSGSAWQGYYLYHGATQVLGELSSTQESHATDYPNDLPVRNYDFFAPIGAEGQQRGHFHRLRRQHLMLESFGDPLAAYPTVLPDEDDQVRWAVRGDGERGYLFINNHQPAIAALPDIDDVRFEVELADRTVAVPSAPFTLHAGVYTAWPLRERFGDIPALTVTAQPITRFDTPNGPVVLFAATSGVGVELQMDGVDADTVQGARVHQENGRVFAVPENAPGIAAEVTVGRTTLVFLDPDTADAVWTGEVDGRDSVVIWRGSAWFDGGFRYVAQDRDGDLDIVPALGGSDLEPTTGAGTVFSRYRVPGEDVSVALPAPEFDIAALAPVRTGGTAGRLSAPVDADFAALAPVEVTVDDALFDGAERLLLCLDWTGDVIRVHAGSRLIADQFWYGRDFEVDLVPYRDEIRESGLWLTAFAWGPESGVYVDPRVRPETTAPLLRVREATLKRIRSRSVR